MTSIQNHLLPYLPNVPPSVTSLGPHGYVGPPAFPVYARYPGPYSGRHGFGHGNGYGNGNLFGYYGYGGYVAPYYIPVIDSSYGYDADGAGPYLYSGPPAEQTLHIVVDLPPSRRSTAPEPDDETIAPPSAPSPKQVHDAPSFDATILVFRDGHRQQVTNYAVMGQTLYVFDDHRQKISLRDLDVPATIKVNDDRGVEFQLPKTS